MASGPQPVPHPLLRWTGFPTAFRRASGTYPAACPEDDGPSCPRTPARLTAHSVGVWEPPVGSRVPGHRIQCHPQAPRGPLCGPGPPHGAVFSLQPPLSSARGESTCLLQSNGTPTAALTACPAGTGGREEGVAPPRSGRPACPRCAACAPRPPAMPPAPCGRPAATKCCPSQDSGPCELSTRRGSPLRPQGLQTEELRHRQRLFQ